MVAITGCGATKKNVATESPNINVYDGTLSTVLGCIFAPQECKKFKKEQKDPELQDEITKEMMEMDEDISKDNK